MNSSNEDHLDLQHELDALGRYCQPRHPGWQTLLERLPVQQTGPAGENEAVEALEPGPGRGRERCEEAKSEMGQGDSAVFASRKSGQSPSAESWRRLLLAAAAGLAAVLAAGLSLWFLGGPAIQAAVLPVEVVRRGVEVTVFSANDQRGPTLYMAGTDDPWRPSPGMALVKDRRMVLHLQQGDNLVKFTDVAATIDPTSVQLVSDTDPLGTKVVEQNFEFDLADANALLKRSLDQKIACVGREGELYEGFLLSYDNASIVLADRPPVADPDAARPKTETISRQRLQSIRLDHKPADLYTRPTLVWTLRAETPGDHLTTLSYLCGDAVWRADYVAVVHPSQTAEDTLDLTAWVTIDNRSGATYEDAGLKLIAGDVNRVRDPWARLVTPGDGWHKEGGTFPEAPAEGQTGTGRPKEFDVKAFFEYKLYTLNQPSTIRNRQIKQLSLFDAPGVRAKRRFVCRPVEGQQMYPDVQLLVKNEEENHLGRPLPKGSVALMAIDPQGDSQLIGRQEIDHTAKDEEVTLEMGRAFDVVYAYRHVEIKRPDPDEVVMTSEFRIRNHRPHEIAVRAIAPLTWKNETMELREDMPDGSVRVSRLRASIRNGVITQSSDPFVVQDVDTAYFDVTVPADSEKTITYTTEHRGRWDWREVYAEWTTPQELRLREAEMAAKQKIEREQREAQSGR